MGNFIALCIAREMKAIKSLPLKGQKLVQIMRIDDGKILEFRNPVLVRDVLANYPNSYVGFFNRATQPLPCHYKLKMGRVYYLLPCPDHDQPTNSRALELELEPRSAREQGLELELKGGTKKRRIKVVITKEQLKELLDKPGGLQEALLLGAKGLKEDDCDCGSSSSTWLPKLETIHEGCDFVCL